ncbi:Ecotin precursor [Sphingobacterium mizutaii]|uniref:Ecotin n=2 Tax=Sphingobacterium mizutaii TaxID=1010 RepID=A0AAJ5BYK1_9SPHI|nr:ecotin family protein [Sphingobacterium mizutaii]SDL63208.1 ecotin [Sphingobacterium mizutaii]SNV36260.1 Ecotin precursor [Sphingobacterium mizutaii]
MKQSKVPALLILMLGLFLMPNASKAQEMLMKINTEIFPAPEKGFKRMVIEVPYSDADNNKKIEFSVGKMMEVDGCNHFGLNGTIETKDLEGWGYQYYVFKTNGDVISTQMACPGAPGRNLFVSAQPTLVPYNGKMPIVVYVPEEYDVRFKIFTSTDEVYRALEDKPSKK